jgi:hypothetical protein
MTSQGSVPRADAQWAKESPLIVKQTANSEATYDWKRCALKIISHGSPTNTTIRLRGEKLPSRYRLSASTSSNQAKYEMRLSNAALEQQTSTTISTGQYSGHGYNGWPPGLRDHSKPRRCKC